MALPQRVGRAAKDLRQLLAEGSQEGFRVLAAGVGDGGEECIDRPHHIQWEEGEGDGGRRHMVQVVFGPRYPFEPPHVLFTTPVYHPNIDSGGRICLDLLKMPPNGAWRPTVSLLDLLQALRVLLREPNPDDPLVPEIAAEYRNDPDSYWLKAGQYGVRPCGGEGGDPAVASHENKLSLKRPTAGSVAEPAEPAAPPSRGLLSLKKRKQINGI